MYIHIINYDKEIIISRLKKSNMLIDLDLGNPVIYSCKQEILIHYTKLHAIVYKIIFRLILLLVLTDTIQ